jgi:hypothetical protein
LRGIPVSHFPATKLNQHILWIKLFESQLNTATG